ncbi:SH3 domain-containing protein [Photobacterium satsumensis]|uniref:SH3 domain-containing protein n=1 Tax=Photobacterium satsumensis TaxID=2910239 RepID=UPI003D145445
MHYKVVKKYTDNPEEPIRVESGELLEFVEESNPEGDWANWVFCRGKDKQGWVPKQVLNIRGESVEVLRDYYAIEHHLSEGEILVSKFELNGWIWCEKIGNEGNLAWAPLNHLERE